MSTSRVRSLPDLVEPSTPTIPEQYDDSALEGVAANIKLLLKLIQDHKNACNAHKNDGRRMLRVAGMMTILDMVRTRIQKCQSFGNKKSAAELRRCNSDLKPHNVPKDKRLAEPVADEKERLRKELNASLAARKSLEIMCSSLGKEKEIMAGELAKKVHLVCELEEHVNDLKAQNESLLEKVRECAAEHKEKTRGSRVSVVGDDGEREVQGNNAALQERNVELSGQLLRSLDGYRAMKRKLRDALEENMAMRGNMEEMGVKVSASLERIRSFKQQTGIDNEELVDIEEEISELEHMFECFDMKVPKKGECGQPNGDQISGRNPVFA